MIQENVLQNSMNWKDALLGGFRVGGGQRDEQVLRHPSTHPSPSNLSLWTDTSENLCCPLWLVGTVALHTATFPVDKEEEAAHSVRALCGFPT